MSESLNGSVEPRADNVLRSRSFSPHSEACWPYSGGGRTDYILTYPSHHNEMTSRTPSRIIIPSVHVVEYGMFQAIWNMATPRGKVDL